MRDQRDVRFGSGDDVLAGTLHVPHGQGPHPAIVMLAGSGPEDRDSGGYFSPIREVFLDTGLAVLSWDKPGVGGSTGHWRRQTFFDQSAGALAGLGWLRQQPEVDQSRTGLWGHSQGGWIAQLVAADDADLAFVIINSGPGVDAVEQDLYGVEHTLRERGANEDDVHRARAYMNRIHQAAIARLPYEQFVADVLAPARGTPGHDYFGEIDADLWTFLVLNVAEPYQPVTALQRIRCPVLAIFGEADSLVPVQQSVRIFEQAFASSGHSDVTIRVFPGDHRIDAPDFADGYLDAMAEWLRDRAQTPAAAERRNPETGDLAGRIGEFPRACSNRRNGQLE